MVGGGGEVMGIFTVGGLGSVLHCSKNCFALSIVVAFIVFYRSDLFLFAGGTMFTFLALFVFRSFVFSFHIFSALGQN